MKAIKTKYLGPTNHLGTRIAASDGDGNRRVYSRYDPNIDAPGALQPQFKIHQRAALLFCADMGWSPGPLATGWLRADEYVHVYAEGGVSK